MDAPRDAPDGHPAHRAVKRCAKSKRAFFELHRSQEERLRLQLTERKVVVSPSEVTTSLDEAARVLRIVYLKLVENPSMTKADAIQYRDDLVKQCSESGAYTAEQGSPNPATHDASSNHSAVGPPPSRLHVPDKQTFQKIAPSWTIEGCGVDDLCVRPCQFKKGTLGWLCLGNCIVQFSGASVRCNLHIQATLFNSSDWPDCPESSEEGCIETVPNSEEIENSGQVPSKRRHQRAGAFQEPPSGISEMLSHDDWDKRWFGLASSVDTSITIGPWGQITLSPKVFRQTLGWQARKQLGRPAARGKSLRGNGGFGCGFQWGGKEFVAPCQLHVWLVVQSSQRWLHPEPDNLAPKGDEEVSSEDEAEQIELEVALNASPQECENGENYSDESGQDAMDRSRPQRRMFKVRRANGTSSGLGLKPAKITISFWHRWFKSMNADTFFDKVQESPEYLRTYTQKAALLETFDRQSDRAVERIACILEKLPKPRGLCKIVDLGSGEGFLASRLEAETSTCFEIINVDAIPLTEATHVHNLASLPNNWSGNFNVAVLCRSLWARDYSRILNEAKRVLVANHSSWLVICEPFRRWFGRDKRRPNCNALPWMIQRCGFSIDWTLTHGTEPLSVVGEDQNSKKVEHELFQYIVARLEPSRCVVCTRLPARTFPRGLRLCMNCEEDEAGLRPKKEILKDLDWKPQWAVDWAIELNEKCCSRYETGMIRRQNRQSERIHDSRRQRRCRDDHPQSNHVRRTGVVDFRPRFRSPGNRKGDRCRFSPSRNNHKDKPRGMPDSRGVMPGALGMAYPWKVPQDRHMAYGAHHPQDRQVSRGSLSNTRQRSRSRKESQQNHIHVSVPASVQQARTELDYFDLYKSFILRSSLGQDHTCCEDKKKHALADIARYCYDRRWLQS